MTVNNAAKSLAKSSYSGKMPADLPACALVGRQNPGTSLP